MRLGQAARTFETTTDEIVKLLAKEFREVNNHPNIKLTAEEVSYFETHFRSEQVDQEVLLAELDLSHEASTDNVESPPAEKEAKQEEPQFVESIRPQVFSLEKDFDEKTKELEQFEVEKPELQGLKVIGKIDLPEPVKKEPKIQKEDEKAAARKRKNDRSMRKPKRNQAAEQRKKEERIAKRKKFEAEKRAKELKKRHYEQNVKAKIQPAPKKKKKKIDAQNTSPKVASNPQEIQKIKKAKGLKRLWLWLNGAYDQYN
jgi:hypothetical protein